MQGAWWSALLLCCSLLVSAAEPLRVGTTGDYPPFSFLDAKSGHHLGSDIDQALSLGAALHRPVVFVPTTWRKLSSDMAEGRFDIAMGGVSVTPARAALGVFTVTYLSDGKTPLVRCADQLKFQTIAQINRPGVRLIVNPGGTNEAFVRQHLAAADLRIFIDNVAIFDEIRANRADVMVTDAIEARLQQRLRPGLCAVHPEHPFDHSTKAYWLPAASPLLPAVQSWLSGALAKGVAQKRLQHWLGYDWHPALDQARALRKLLALIDERLSLMPDVARYKWNHGLAIEDPPREQALLRSVAEQAQQQGLNPTAVSRFFAAQIEASKVVQRELFARWQAAGQGPFAEVVDLGTQIRPRLDQLNPSLLAAWAAAPLPLASDRVGSLDFEAISPAAAEAAVSPLLQ